MIEAGHPVPDGAGLEAALRAIEFADGADADDLVLVLMSGGASANWIAPAAGVTFADKQAVTRALLRSGATIGEINTVRKHLSRIKGGRLARHAYPAKLVTIAISDVPGDDPSAIGSGPTVPDPTTLADARAIVAKYRLDLPASVTAALADANNESPKPGDPVFAGSQFALAARPADALRAAEAAVRAAGYECVSLGRSRRRRGARGGGGARQARARAARARQTRGDPLGRRIDRHHPRPGPRRTQPGIRPGAGDRACRHAGGGGACRRHRRHRWRRRRRQRPRRRLLDGETVARAKALGLDPAAFLADNNSTGFFAALGDLLMPGPTYTNVNDFRAIVVDRP